MSAALRHDPWRAQARSVVVLVLVAALATAPRLATADPPQAHHAGEWTAAKSWGPSSVTQAVHMVLVRGDSLHLRPHSQLLWWGNWFYNVGGLWGWNPTTDHCSGTLDSNLTALPISPPPYNLFCSGGSGLANGDQLMLELPRVRGRLCSEVGALDLVIGVGPEWP